MFDGNSEGQSTQTKKQQFFDGNIREDKLQVFFQE